MKWLLTIVVSSFLLVGCSGTKILDIISAPAPIMIQHPPAPPSLTMLKVEWRVLNAKVLQEMLESGADVQFIALSPAGYENLSLNMGEIKRYIRQQKAVIIYYQRLTDGAKVETKEGKKWKLQDLIPGIKDNLDASLVDTSLEGLKYLTDPLPSTE